MQMHLPDLFLNVGTHEEEKNLIHRDLHGHSPGWRCGNHGENHGEDDSS